MSFAFAPRLRTLVFGLALCASGAALHAQSLSGSLSDDTTGPVTAGVHQVIGAISVAAGKTLTIQAGAILKFTNTQLTLDGTLKVQGTSPSPVIFTSFHDDAAGGDTNGNGGATVPAPGDWQGLTFHAGSAASTLNFADIRYSGSGGWTAVYIDQAGANIGLNHCTIRNSSAQGINLNNVAAFPTVGTCNFLNNTGAAVENMQLASVPGFSGNSASGNGGNYMHVTGATVSAPLSIGAANVLNGALVVAPQLNVAVGGSLTLGAGVVIKMQSAQFNLDGPLFCNGTSGSPVVLTAFADDTAGGDTNNDTNTTSPAAGAWQGLTFHAASSGSVLNYTDIRYAGSGGWTAVYINQPVAAMTLDHCTIRNASQPAINLNNTASFPTVSNCNLINNGGFAIDNMLIQSVPGFSANTASGNGSNSMRVTTASVAASMSIALTNILNGALVFTPQLNVSAGATLTFGAGCVVKSTAAQITLDGKLVCNGTLPAPVVFTSFADDTAAGDTNNDGAGSSPVPGNWQGITFHSGSSGSALTYAEIRYAGSGGWTAVYVNQPVAAMTFDHCTVRHSSQAGMNFNGVESFPTVTHCTFTGNAGVAVDGLPLVGVPGFTFNAASSNGGNYIRLAGNAITTSVTVNENNCLNGSLVPAGAITVAPSGTLHLLPRVHFKMSGAQVFVSGAIDAQGTSVAPVVFTSIHDDSIDGDTNGNGNATLPAPGNWLDIQVNSAASASLLSHVKVRYAGQGGFYGIWSQTAQLALRNVRVESCSTVGYRLENAASPATDLTAYACTGPGFDLIGGNFLLSRSTSANNVGAGFNAAGFGGTLRSTIAWGNGGANYAGFGPGSVFFSDGSPTLAGGNGNINVDPKFVSAATGDLTLQKTSPCVDTGDPADVAFGTDDAGYPRFLDGNLNKIKVVDMGAYEFDHVHLAISGTPTPGGTLTLTTSGTTGLTTYLFIGVVPGETLLKTYGPLFMNLGAPYVLIGWFGAPSAIPIGVPGDLPTPLPLIFQELGIQGTTGNDPGNVSNPVYVTIQ